jgi:hypothetical protein
MKNQVISRVLSHKIVMNFWVNVNVNQALEENIVIVVYRVIMAFHRRDAVHAIRVTHPDIYAILKLVVVFVHQTLRARPVKTALRARGASMF